MVLAGARRRGSPHAADRSRRTGEDAGFTLVEVLAAVVVFVVVSTATIGVLVQALRAVRENSDRSMAASIARSQVEYLRSLGTSAIPIGLLEGAVPPGQDATRVDPALLDPGFTIRTTSNWVGFDQTTSSCAAATPGQAYLRVSVEVASRNLGVPTTIDTVIFPNTTTSQAGTGSATIAIIDQVGRPVSDTVVQGTDPLNPSNSFALTTGSDGCLFVPNLTPSGSLAVHVSRSGYVSATPTGTDAVLQISADSVSRSSFKLAAAATLRFGGEDQDYPIPGGLPVTWQFNSTGASATAAVVGTPVSGLWPEPAGVSAYVGACTDADPLSYSLARQAFPLDAGGTTVATLRGAPVRLRGLPADTLVRATYSGPDAACAVTSIDLGPSNDRGIVRVTLPYGDWTFSADGQTQVLGSPLAPLGDGTAPPTVTVSFTLADLDNPCPSPSGTASPSPSGTASPSPSGPVCPTPSESPAATPSGTP